MLQGAIHFIAFMVFIGLPVTAILLKAGGEY